MTDRTPDAWLRAVEDARAELESLHPHGPVAIDENCPPVAEGEPVPALARYLDEATRVLGTERIAALRTIIERNRHRREHDVTDVPIDHDASPPPPAATPLASPRPRTTTTDSTTEAATRGVGRDGPTKLAPGTPSGSRARPRNSPSFSWRPLTYD